MTPLSFFDVEVCKLHPPASASNPENERIVTGTAMSTILLPLHSCITAIFLWLLPLLAFGISIQSYSTSWTERGSAQHRRPFRLVTWNLLAPIYSPPNKYTWCDPLHLEWSYREPLIIERLRSMQADVVCLQEVQIDLWNGGFQECLQQQLGYSTTLLQNVTNQHPVATAILIHQDCGIRLNRVESRSRVLLAVLEVPSSSPPYSSPDQMLYLANVHLDAGAGPEHDITRFQQIKSLLKRLNFHIQQDLRSTYGNKFDVVKKANPAIILCGDFNFVPPHPLYTFLETGEYDNSNPSSSHQSFSSSLLPFQNIFAHHPLPMTYGSGRVLDYIWASSNASLQTLETVCYYPTPASENEPQDLRPCRPQPWPSANHPSDHVPIGALLLHSLDGE